MLLEQFDVPGFLMGVSGAKNTDLVFSFLSRNKSVESNEQHPSVRPKQIFLSVSAETLKFVN